jgi:hypothetical protein
MMWTPRKERKVTVLVRLAGGPLAAGVTITTAAAPDK